MEEARRPERFRGRNRLYLEQKRADTPYERISLVALVEQVQRLSQLVLVEIAGRGLVQEVERVGERLALREPLAREEEPRAAPDRHQGHVDQREGRVEEVVVVARHELPDLVDEEPESDSSDHGCNPSRRVRDDRHADDQCQAEERTAPEQVSDVQAVAAELRVAREDQSEPDDEDRQDAHDEEGLDQGLRIDRAHGCAEEALDVPLLEIVSIASHGRGRAVDDLLVGPPLLRS